MASPPAAIDSVSRRVCKFMASSLFRAERLPFGQEGHEYSFHAARNYPRGKRGSQFRELKDSQDAASQNAQFIR
jgi:hypothetical protein